jgi:hypothetical protein
MQIPDHTIKEEGVGSYAGPFFLLIRAHMLPPPCPIVTPALGYKLRERWHEWYNFTKRKAPKPMIERAPVNNVPTPSLLIAPFLYLLQPKASTALYPAAR